MIKSFAVAGILFASLAQAALPPYHERNRVFTAIVADQRVETAVTDPRFRQYATGQIDSLRYLGYTAQYSRYSVQTGRCLLDINVRTVAVKSPEGKVVVGPGKIELAIAKSLRCQ